MTGKKPPLDKVLDFDAARSYALGRLERDLSPILTYHSLLHTRDEVFPAAVRLAGLEGVDGEATVLLQTAVLFHDIGFTRQRIDHETISIQIAIEVLPALGYRPAQVEIICGMINATRLREPPRTLLEEIIVDSDLDVLGRPDFLNRNHDLRLEAQAFGLAFTDEQWYGQQLGFLQWHRYRTAAARSLREVCKQENMMALESLLARSKEASPE